MEVGGFEGETKLHLVVVAKPKPRVDRGVGEWWMRRRGTVVKERFRFGWREIERSLVQNLCIVVVVSSLINLQREGLKGELLGFCEMVWPLFGYQDNSIFLLKILKYLFSNH